MLYETRTDDHAASRVPEALTEGRVDFHTFTSPSSVRGFFEILGVGARAALESGQVVAIGPTTAAALAERGVSGTLVPAVSTLEGMIQAMLDRAAEA